MRTPIVAGIALSLLPSAGVSQGTVSGQGFGYPTGQFSARASGTGGAIAPFDEVSPVNPAAVALWQRGVLFFHYEPEFRSSSAGGSDASTRVARFPLVGGAARITSRGALALTVSTYLDRTWETSAVSRDVIGDREVDFTTRYSSNGAINDVRAAFAWSFSTALRVGAAYHAYTGENRLKLVWDFPDGEPFGDVNHESTLSYGGSAVSLGAEWRPSRAFAVSGYTRLGGSARVRTGDTLISHADMPNHAGLGVRYDGISGTVFAAGWERVTWSAMQGLGSASLGVRDAGRLSLGMETAGPSLGGSTVVLRAGFSQRTLPFDAASTEVRERMYTFGAGYPFARARGSFDFAIKRANRDAGSAQERAWLFTLGFTISP